MTELLDAEHLITPSSLKLSSDKHSIEFDIERDNICQGNSVIAVRDKNGNIMWNWHIWVTDYALTKTYEVLNDPARGGSVRSFFMEVPLGYCDAEVRVGGESRTFHITVKQTENDGSTGSFSTPQITGDYTYGPNAPYYQWGRKDPLLPSNGMGNIDKPFYDNQYSVSKQTINTTDIKDLILYPYMHCANYTSKYLELWNKGNTLTTINNNPVYKTIYDPDPYLYSLPRSAAFSGFTTSTISGAYNMGWNFYCNYTGTGPTVFFHALGWRNPQVGYYDYGLYYTSAPASSTTAVDLDFGYNYIYSNLTQDSRLYGFTVRPTLEQ